MAENMEDVKTYRKIYDDTNYFINAIISDYGFYGRFIDAVKNGKATMSLNRKKLKKEIDENWVSAIEASLPALDTVIRRPSKYIEEREEVLPIELSHNITSRSLMHLSQHTDYIQKIEGDMITPSKILNVFHDETMMTYENKFINTLILELYIFVNKRYMKLREEGDVSTSCELNFNSDFSFEGSKGRINFSVEMEDVNGSGNEKSISERIAKMNSVATMYYNSEFAKAMGKNYVKPPIMRTNAILKNKDLSECLALWEFIQSYNKIGCKIDVEQSSEKPDEEYISELYSLLSLQYMMFRYHISGDFTDTGEVLESRKSELPFMPGFNTSFDEINVEDYNVYDSEYKRVVPVSALSNRRLSEDELKIRKAVDTAFAVQRILDARKKQEERRIAEEKRALENEQKRKALAAQKAVERLKEKALRAKQHRRKPNRPKSKAQKIKMTKDKTNEQNKE